MGQVECGADDAVGVESVVAVDRGEVAGLPELRNDQVRGAPLVDAREEGQRVRMQVGQGQKGLEAQMIELLD